MPTKNEIKKKILNYAYKECFIAFKDRTEIGKFSIQSLEIILGAEKGSEKYKLYEALHELLVQNIIMRDPHNYDSPYSFTLTTKGRKIAESRLDIDEYSLRLENYVTSDALLDECQDLFNNGNYEKAVFSAYRHLETKVREKAKLTPNDFGQDLVTKAFNPDRGMLRILTCETRNEEAGIFNLFLGAIKTFKNPPSHRIVYYDNPKSALQIIVFAELLLNLVKISVKRKRDSGS